MLYQENNSIEFQQGDNANQQWTNQQDEFGSNKEEAPAAAETMEAETTLNGHGQDEVKCLKIIVWGTLGVDKMHQAIIFGGYLFCLNRISIMVSLTVDSDL